MNLMLAVLIGSTVLGLAAAAFGRRQNAVIVAVAVLMTTLYYFVQRTL
jgi:hypothetical protein